LRDTRSVRFTTRLSAVALLGTTIMVGQVNPAFAVDTCPQACDNAKATLTDVLGRTCKALFAECPSTTTAVQLVKDKLAELVQPPAPGPYVTLVEERIAAAKAAAMDRVAAAEAALQDLLDQPNPCVSTVDCSTILTTAGNLANTVLTTGNALVADLKAVAQDAPGTVVGELGVITEEADSVIGLVEAIAAVATGTAGGAVATAGGLTGSDLLAADGEDNTGVSDLPSLDTEAYTDPTPGVTATKIRQAALLLPEVSLASSGQPVPDGLRYCAQESISCGPAPRPPDAAAMAYTQHTQERKYTCGPAAEWMSLRWMNGWAPSEDELSLETHTTTDGSSWRNVKMVLNKRQQVGVKFVAWDDNVSSTNELLSNLVYDMIYDSSAHGITMLVNQYAMKYWQNTGKSVETNPKAGHFLDGMGYTWQQQSSSSPLIYVQDSAGSHAGEHFVPASEAYSAVRFHRGDQVVIW
jgi:hypothetical protein